MESVDLSESANSKLEVFKDAFAPQQPSRIIRAWERAPVPATLPRFQGQKIWKRTGMPAEREKDKENFNAAQHELRAEGMGARKRARLLGAKENIGDATWSQNLDHTGMNSAPSITNAKERSDFECSKAAPVPLNDATANALQFVPRKRTNANHVITPRKPMRQTTLNGQAKTQLFVRSPHPSPEVPRRRKSMRKSIRNSIARPISDVPQVVVEEEVAMENRDRAEPSEIPLEEAPITNWDSVEQLDTFSLRMPPNQDSDTVEQLESCSKPQANENPDTAGQLKASLQKSVIEDPGTNPQLEGSRGNVPMVEVDLEAENEIAHCLLNDRLNILFDLTENRIPTSQDPQSELERHLGSDVDQSLTFQEASQATNVPLKYLSDDEGSLIPSQEDSAEPESGSLALIDETQLPRDRQASETPLTILQSIEVDNNSRLGQQGSKTMSSPKKKRGPSQRRGGRRSTRTTRASSVLAEEQADSVDSAAVPAAVSTDGAGQQESMSTDHETENQSQTNPGKSVDLFELSRSHLIQDAMGIFDTETSSSKLKGSSQGPDSPLPSVITDLERIDVPEGQIKREDAVDLEEFDVSTQITLQLCGDTQKNVTKAEDFELQPAFLSSTVAFSDKRSDEKGRELISESPDAIDSSGEDCRENSSPVRFSPIKELEAQRTPKSEQPNVELLQNQEPASTSADTDVMADESGTMSSTSDDLPGSSTPDPTTSKLVETISENAQVAAYDHDETDMLRSFLDRVQANKAAKASTHVPRRKRSLPHSPLRLPLGENTNISPSPPKLKGNFDVNLPGPSPSKRKRPNELILADGNDTITERRPTRRSGRTRLPVIKAPLGAPSHIPVRRLGQDGDTTVTLKRNEEKELAALTRLNTRKNKAGFQSVPEYLAKKAQEKDDPTLRQRLLKEVFDEKTQRAKKERRKTVVWAKELTQYQTLEKRKLDGEKEETKETGKVTGPEEKKSAVQVGIRSKIALGMAVNGTPAPKRKKKSAMT